MAKKKQIPAVGYARRSTDMQERSIPDQKAYVEKWAKENGYAIQRWYVDDAISGTSAKGRADFERLMRDAEASGGGRDFETVLVYDISRFSRGGTNETGFYLHRLHLAGVEAIFCAEGIPDGEEGELLQGVRSWQARQYSVKLSRDCIRGTISHIMEKQCAPGGRPPYGYDKQHATAGGQVLRTFRWLPDGSKQEFGPDGKLVRTLARGESMKKAKSDTVRFVPSDPERVKVVQRVFDLCLGGYGYQHIAHRLNDDGVPSPVGQPWTPSLIARMLRNPVYRGALAWNRRTLGKLNGVAGDGTLRPKRGFMAGANDEADWYVVEKAHEPLVSPETFEKAKRAVQKRSTLGGQAKRIDRALLSGLIVCGHCGYNFRQHKMKARSGKRWVRYRYYVDGGYYRSGKAVCKPTNVPADGLDGFVIEQVGQVLMGDHAGREQAVESFVQAAMAGDERNDPNDAAELEKQLAALDKRIQTTVAMLADPDFEGLDELKATLAGLKRRRDGLREHLEQQQPEQVVPYTEADLRAWADDRFRRFEQITKGKASFDETRQLVQAYCDRIVIDPHARRGTLYLPEDAFACLEREFTPRVALGDPRGGIKSKGEA